MIQLIEYLTNSVLFSNSFYLLMVIISSALTGSVVFFISDKYEKTRITLNLFGALIKFLFLVIIVTGLYRLETYEIDWELAKGLHFILRADSLAMLFAILSSALWLVTTVYAIGYFKKENGENNQHLQRFFGFFSLCITSSIGISFAGNLFTFLIFYECLTLSTYPLVTHSGTQKAIQAGRKYLALTLSGGLVLLIGTIFLAVLTGGTYFDQGKNMAHILSSTENQLPFKILFWVLICGVGVKTALVPFHPWLPTAMVAPAPVSALLHAVAVVKAGAFGIIRIIYDVFGVEIYAKTLNLSAPLVLWASITIIYGSLKALQQTNIKKRLAYSTVSQLSYITLGVAMAGPITSIGGLIHLVHQGLMKITLFFCAGVLQKEAKINEIKELNGIGKIMPWTMICFTIGALGMIGIPPVAGFVSKWFLATGALEAEYSYVIWVLIGSSILNAMYFLPLCYRIWFLPLKSSKTYESNNRQKHKILNNPWLYSPAIITALLSLLTGIFASHEMSPLSWSIFILTEFYFL